MEKPKASGGRIVRTPEQRQATAYAKLWQRLNREVMVLVESRMRKGEIDEDDARRLQKGFDSLVELAVLGVGAALDYKKDKNRHDRSFAFLCMQTVAKYQHSEMLAPEVQANIGQAMVVIRQFAPQAIEADEEEEAEMVDDGPHSSVAEWIK